MSGLLVPMAALAALLAVAGGAKAARPDATVRALAGVGVRLAPSVVRGGAAAEGAVGLWWLATGGADASWAVAACYAGFVAFLAAALRSGSPVATCGCFGEADSPPTAGHLTLCLAGSAVAVAAAVDTTPAPARWLAAHPAQAPALVVLTAAAAYAAYLLMSAAPRLAGWRRLP
ncbi:MAG TPA: MauE/DoxX family redox-associated membrane protein [Acidimicrobiales bacterium]|nr:MauE/DoxX family redox-associated membrane protein [Acidimicrobiales bacterium]